MLLFLGALPHGYISLMLTTIIAIYGAALSTTSALLGAWYFLRSGPRLQAQAYVWPPVGWEELDDDTIIMLRVWNTGRAEITVNILDVTATQRGKDKIATLLDRGDLEGPEVPIRLPGHSGEEWSIELHSVATLHPSVSTTLSVSLLVGGNRHVDVPVLDGMPGKAKRPLILKPASS